MKPMKSDEEKDPQVRVVDRRWWAQQAERTEPAVEPPKTRPTVVEDLERRLADTTEQLRTALTEQRRAAAEFEQATIRIRRDVAREVERGRRAVINELLEVLDNLDRAVAAARGSEAPDAAENLMRGVELVRDQFLAKLDGLGVSRVPALGQTFDAAIHDAVSTAPVPDPAQNGVVVAVLKEGYAIAGELLRPASVVVGQHA
jgi:molecular chaperone GrpE